jgi:hypothetical protein
MWMSAEWNHGHANTDVWIHMAATSAFVSAITCSCQTPRVWVSFSSQATLSQCLRLAFCHIMCGKGWLQLFKKKSITSPQTKTSLSSYLFKNYDKINHKIDHLDHFKVYNSVAFSTFTILYKHHHYQLPKHLHHPKRKPPLAVTPHSASSLLLAATNLLSVSMDLPLLDT